jgi:hypothetical protein
MALGDRDDDDEQFVNIELPLTRDQVRQLLDSMEGVFNDDEVRLQAVGRSEISGELDGLFKEFKERLVRAVLIGPAAEPEL